MRRLPLLLFAASLSVLAAPPPVTLARLPATSLQPQVARDAAGGLHRLYFTGDPSAGNLWYQVSGDGGRHWSPPLRVNHRPGDAIAVGNMRGAHLVLNRGTVDVAWMGAGDPGHPAMWFAQLPPGARAFTRERNLAPPMMLDGGALAAAGATVEVYWHGLAAGDHTEAQRRVWMARSGNGGRSFAPARPINAPATGVCGCCGMAAAADAHGNFDLVYRAATNLVHRDLYLLHSSDGGRSFTGADFSPWQVGYCVMSTAQLTPTPSGLLAAWEQRGQVLWARVGIDGRIGPPHPAPGAPADRKYPVVAVNAAGQVLMAWTEGMAWKRGGSLHWQLYTPTGQPLGASGQAPGVPMWSLVAAWARPDGGFTVLY